MRRKVAVDVHRRSLYVLIVAADGEEVLRRRFTHDARGETELLAVLQAEDQVVLEATTGSLRLANRLESVVAAVLVLDPQQTRAVGFRGRKTDYRDCRALLRYLDDPEAPCIWRPDRRTRELRQLTRERFAFNQSLVRLKNRVRTLLADEGLQPPSAPWEPAGQEWLDQQVLSGCTRRILDRELTAIAVETALKAEQEQELAEVALSCPTSQRLMQLLGFGAALSVMWVGEVGDLERFSTSKQLVSYAGLDPSVHHSGAQQRNGSITKSGRSQLRWIMVEVAWRHVHEQGPEAGYFHRLVARGKMPQVAIVALARRLLVLAYTLLRREETHRELDLERYEAKLARLAARRPVLPAPEARPTEARPTEARPTEAGPTEPEPTEPEPCDRDWAADRLEALTGLTSPRRAAGKRRRARRVPRTPPEGTPSGHSGSGPERLRPKTREGFDLHRSGQPTTPQRE